MALVECLVGLDPVLVVGVVDLEPVLVERVLGLVRRLLALELVGLG